MTPPSFSPKLAFSLALSNVPCPDQLVITPTDRGCTEDQWAGDMGKMSGVHTIQHRAVVPDSIRQRMEDSASLFALHDSRNCLGLTRWADDHSATSSSCNSGSSQLCDHAAGTPLWVFTSCIHLRSILRMLHCYSWYSLRCHYHMMLFMTYLCYCCSWYCCTWYSCSWYCGSWYCCSWYWQHAAWRVCTGGLFARLVGQCPSRVDCRPVALNNPIHLHSILCKLHCCL